jgi:hypothetical protein
MTAPVKTAISISRQDSNSGFFLLMNDYAGLLTALLAGASIGDLPPLMQPELLRDGQRISLRPQARCARFSQPRAGSGDSERTPCR